MTSVDAARTHQAPYDAEWRLLDNAIVALTYAGREDFFCPRHEEDTQQLADTLRANPDSDLAVFIQGGFICAGADLATAQRRTLGLADELTELLAQEYTSTDTADEINLVLTAAQALTELRVLPDLSEPRWRDYQGTFGPNSPIHSINLDVIS